MSNITSPRLDVTPNDRAAIEVSRTQLAKFARGEMSAVETYQKALDVTTEPKIRGVLESCQASHRLRVDLLRDRLVAIGGEMPESSGAWGSLVRLLEGAAASLSASAAVSLLEEGEDIGVSDYLRDADEADVETRRFVNYHLLTEQVQTHRKMSELKMALVEPS